MDAQRKLYDGFDLYSKERSVGTFRLSGRTKHSIHYVSKIERINKGTVFVDTLIYIMQYFHSINDFTKADLVREWNITQNVNTR